MNPQSILHRPLGFNLWHEGDGEGPTSSLSAHVHDAFLALSGIHNLPMDAFISSPSINSTHLSLPTNPQFASLSLPQPVIVPQSLACKKLLRRLFFIAKSMEAWLQRQQREASSELNDRGRDRAPAQLLLSMLSRFFVAHSGVQGRVLGASIKQVTAQHDFVRTLIDALESLYQIPAEECSAIEETTNNMLANATNVAGGCNDAVTSPAEYDHKVWTFHIPTISRQVHSVRRHDVEKLISRYQVSLNLPETDPQNPMKLSARGKEQVGLVILRFNSERFASACASVQIAMCWWRRMRAM